MKPSASGFKAGDLEGARGTAERFLQAVTRGDAKTAKSLLILVKGESMDFESMHDSIASYELGEAKADGGVVVLVATVHAKPGQEAPPPLPLVIKRVKADWKIDMGASINRMLGGVDLEAMMQQMAQGLGEAMAQGIEGLGQAMAQGLGAAQGERTSSGGTKKGTRSAKPKSTPKGKTRPAKKQT